MRKLTPYQRIVRNARLGRAVALSRTEVFQMAIDDAIATTAYNDDDADEAVGRKAGTELKGR